MLKRCCVKGSLGHPYFLGFLFKTQPLILFSFPVRIEASTNEENDPDAYDEGEEEESECEPSEPDQSDVDIPNEIVGKDIEPETIHATVEPSKTPSHEPEPVTPIPPASPPAALPSVSPQHPVGSEPPATANGSRGLMGAYVGFKQPSIILITNSKLAMQNPYIP